MFMQIAVGAVGVGVVLMIGYIVIAQVRAAMPTTGLDNATLGNITAGMESAQVTIFAGFGLVAVGIIVMAAFGLINIFK